jgi:prepilin-type N-terminal cleavage/methylation domain-containing protein
MKKPSLLNSNSQPALAKSSAGFTLMELLTVMTITVVLAGLVISGASYAQKRSSMERAKAEIQAISTALESYKIDNGDYPRSTNTDSLNPQTSFDPTSSAYRTAALELYVALSGDSNKDGQAGDIDTVTSEKTKAYFEFRPNMLFPKPVVGSYTANSVQYLADPFKNAYGYSTANSVDPTKGYNPTFDLWSTAGETGAKDSQNRDNNKKWVKNW